MEDVVAALENMIEQTQKMMEGIEKSQEEYGGEEYAALKKEMQNFESLLWIRWSRSSNDWAGRPKRYISKLLSGLRKRPPQKSKKRSRNSFRKPNLLLLRAIKSPQAALNSLGKRRTWESNPKLDGFDVGYQERYLEEGLEEARAERALAMLEQSLSLRSQNAPMGLDDETVRAADEAQKVIVKFRKYARRLKINSDLKQGLNSSEKQKMKNISQKQAAMNDGIKRLRQMMERMNQQVPLFGEEHQGQLNQAGRSSEASKLRTQWSKTKKSQRPTTASSECIRRLARCFR